MNTTDAIRARRSVRKYIKAEIPQEHIDCILEAAMMCPSACNKRPYEFAVIKSENKKDELAAISANWGMLRQASAAIVVCAVPELEKDIGHEFWQQDCSAATQNMLLQATELGYGTCWCGAYPVKERTEAIKKALDLEDGLVPFSVIALGVAAENPAAKGFYDKSRVKYI